MKVKVVVVVLNWNGWKDTIDCLRSLEALNCTYHRVVVVDNGSTNDSVRRIREAFPGVDLIETGANLGFSGGNNVGIQDALQDGVDFVWLLNNDTCVDANALSAMVNAAEADPRVGAVGSVLFFMDQPASVQSWGGGMVSMWLGRSRHSTSPVLSQHLDYICGASMLLRVQALQQVGVLDDGFFLYWEDTDLSFRLRRAGWKLAVAADSRVYHKESASLGGNKSPVLDRYFNRSAVRFFQRHAAVPWLPIWVGMLGRILKRGVRGDWQRLQSVWLGWQGRK